MARLIALVPAHNEAASIAGTIRSLQSQTRPPDEITVICDNCTDSTSRIARGLGASVFHSVGNKTKKAGALNQALATFLPQLHDDDFVMILDADIHAPAELVSSVLRNFARKPHLGAVSANALINSEGSLLVRFQAMEYERNRRYTSRKGDKTLVCLSGACTTFRVSTFRRLYAEYGEYYHSPSWTEDWQITYALRHLGVPFIRPASCLVVTSGVPEWKALFNQRQRWSHGYMEAISRFKLTRHTLLPWLGVFLWAFTTMIWAIWLALMVYMIPTGQGFHLRLWILAVSSLFVVTRVVTVKSCGWRAMLLASAMVPEMIYGWWLTAAIGSGIVKHLFKLSGQWADVRGEVDNVLTNA